MFLGRPELSRDNMAQKKGAGIKVAKYFIIEVFLSGELDRVGIYNVDPALRRGQSAAEAVTSRNLKATALKKA